MHGDHVGHGVTDDTARDVLGDLCLRHGHHGDGGRGGQPVGLVVTTGVVAHVVEVTEDEGHSAEPL